MRVGRRGGEREKRYKKEEREGEGREASKRNQRRECGGVCVDQ